MTYESELERKIREDVEGKIGKVLKPKSDKREQRKYETVKAIVESLPSTLQVLHKKTELSKTTLKRYLKNLMSVRAVRRELDMYFLDADVQATRQIVDPLLLRRVWDRWQQLPEYKTPKALERTEEGLALKLSLRGKKAVGTKEMRKERVSSYKKKNKK